MKALITPEDISKFLQELKTKIVKSERETFIQQNQWLIMNMDEGQHEDYIDILADLIVQERELFDSPESTFIDWYINKGLELGLPQNEALKFAQHKLREKKKIDREKELEDIKKVKPEVEEEVEQQRLLTQKITVRDMWLKIVERRSYFNEVPCILSFHTLIGQLLKDLRFYKGNGEVFNLKCNMFWIQDSRSGKGKLVDVLIDVIVLIDFLTYAEFKGNESDAVLLRHFKYFKDIRRGYDFEKEIPGKLEKFDFYVYREARPLIKPHHLTEQTAEYYLHILEDKPIPKELEKWSGHETMTYGKGSLVATSRPVSTLSKFIVESGLMQRCLCYLRRLTPEMRERMRERASLMSINKDANKIYEEYNSDIKELATELINIRVWAKDLKMKISDEKKINSYINDKTKELNNRISNQLIDLTYIDIAHSFVGGWLDYIDKLMYQNAIIRRSKVIEMQDVVSALDLIFECYEQLELWLQENVIPDSRVRREQYTFYKFIKNLIETDDKARAKTNLKYVVQRLVLNRLHPISEARAYQVVRDFTSSDNSPFSTYEVKGDTYLKNKITEVIK